MILFKESVEPEGVTFVNWDRKCQPKKKEARQKVVPETAAGLKNSKSGKSRVGKF